MQKKSAVQTAMTSDASASTAIGELGEKMKSDSQCKSKILNQIVQFCLRHLIAFMNDNSTFYLFSALQIEHIVCARIIS